MRVRIFVVVLAAGFSGPGRADSIDINLNSDSIQATYASNWRTAEFNLGLLSNSDKDNWVASAGLLTLGETQPPGTRIEVGLGGKVYLASASNQDVLALGLGGQLRVFPSGGPVGVAGYVFYAPDVVTSGDAQQFWEAGARVEFEAIQSTASIYLGYRKARAQLDNGLHVTVDSGAYAGVRIHF